MDGTVPRDIAREKQQTLATHLGQLEHQKASLGATSVDHKEALQNAVDILEHWAHAYKKAPQPLRRDFNQACFERILLDETDGEPTINSAEQTELAEILTTATVENPRQ